MSLQYDFADSSTISQRQPRAKGRGGGGGKLGQNQVWKEIEEIYRASGNVTEVCNNGGWGTWGSNQKASDARK